MSLPLPMRTHGMALNCGRGLTLTGQPRLNATPIMYLHTHTHAVGWRVPLQNSWPAGTSDRTLLDNSIFADFVKTRSRWVGGPYLRPVIGSLTRGGTDRDTDTRRPREDSGRDRRDESESQGRRGLLSTAAAGRRAWNSLSDLPDGTNPADPLILDSWPPEL